MSDQTGVTVETLGHSLLEQFDGLEAETVTVPFVDTVDKAQRLASAIDDEAETSGVRPVVFASLVQESVRMALRSCRGLVLDFFDAFLAPLEVEFERQSSNTLRSDHGVLDSKDYNSRIEATNYALAADDGHAPDYYDRADVILIGVSRSGKTPTCLYLALQYGVFAANYPLTGDELETGRLPRTLEAYRQNLYGLTISPERLRQIRLERRTSGRYASAQQVSFELRAAEALFRRLGIRSIDTTHSSVEEIASKILSDTGLERRLRG